MTAQGEQARLLLDAFAAAGVRDVIVSPGSRSTPLVHAAATHGTLRCHDVIDERAAGFFALGRAKATGAPPLLLCTSGSAPTHYLPALVEAAAAFTPLVVLSADRPLSLQGCGASQTIDQVKLYGDQVRWFADLGAPATTVDELRALRRVAAQAVFRSLHPLPGPVHVNARADKPLEPAPSVTERDREIEARARRVGAERHVKARPPRVLPHEDTLAAVADQLAAAERGILVCGPAPLARRRDVPLVLELARRTGLALLAESTSQARFTGPAREDVAALDAFDAVLGSSHAEALAPDLVLQIGAAPVSASFDRFLRALGPVPRIVVDPYAWPDPQGTATEIVQAEVRATLEGLLGRLDGPSPAGAWLERIRRLDRAAWAAVRDCLHAADDASEGAFVRALIEAVPKGALLSVGNSLPVRHLDAFCPGTLADLPILSQRGAAGIDGNVAAAAGAADAAGVPTILLTGDVALLHDLGGLEAARHLRAPLVVVVLHNDGGRIFEQLPVAQAGSTAPLLSHWTTPHGVSFGPAAALFGHRHARLERASELPACLTDALSRDGCTLLECVVPPEGAARLAGDLRRRVDHAIGEVLR